MKDSFYNQQKEYDIKKWGISCLIKLMFCYIIYGMFFHEFLLNRQDAMWNGTFMKAGNWELSLGRWAIRYWDKFHYGVSVHPLSTVITLMFFILGTCVLVDLFHIRIGSLMDYIVSGLFLSNMIVCVSISYLYTSGIYGLAFFFSVLCIWCIEKIVSSSCDFTTDRKIIIVFFTAILSIVFVLSLYQAYLGCIGLVGAMYLIYVICCCDDVVYLKKYLYVSSITAICGAVLYRLMLHVELLHYEVELSSYNGANSLSLNNILDNIITTVPRAYKIALQYMLGTGHKWNLNNGKSICLLLLFIVFMSIVYSFLRHRNIVRLIASSVLFLVLPIFINIIMILIPTSQYNEQQTAPMALLFPTVVALCIGLINKGQKRLMETIIFRIVLLISIFVIWGSIYQVTIDQEAMRQGTIAAKNISDRVVSELQNQGLYSSDNKFAIVGEAVKNPLVYVNSIYSKANVYAKIIGPYWQTELDEWTWRGIFQNLSGINLPRCGREEYEEILVSPEVADMPIFPQEGSIKEVNGLIVIKVSSL